MEFIPSKLTLKTAARQTKPCFSAKIKTVLLKNKAVIASKYDLKGERENTSENGSNFVIGKIKLRN